MLFVEIKTGAGDAAVVAAAILAAEIAARGFTGVAVHHAAAGDDFVDAVKQAGLVLDVSTVNDAALIARWRTRARCVEPITLPSLGYHPA